MINKLTAKIQKTNAPIVVGLDPMLNYIPKHIQEKAFKEYGETLEGAAEAIWQCPARPAGTAAAAARSASPAADGLESNRNKTNRRTFIMTRSNLSS